MKKRYWFFLGALLVGIPVAIQVLFCFEAPCRYLQANWSAGEILTYIGTVFLGGIAAWQNERLKNSNDESQDRLEKLTKEANRLSYISKVIEYELLKKEVLERCIDSFQKAVEAQHIVECFDKDEKVDRDRVLETERRIDDAYLHISGHLKDRKHNGAKEYYHCVDEMNNNFKWAIDIIKKHVDGSEINEEEHNLLLKHIKVLNNERMNMEKQKIIFLSNYQKSLDELIYGKYISEDEIKSIY